MAREAGTSVAVVSYVVNNGPRPVSKALRERVLEAICTTGYRPNAVAKALASGATGTIGLIVPNINNPYLSELAHAVGTAAHERDINILLGDSADDISREARLLENFATRRVDGLLFYGVDGCPPQLERLKGEFPVLVIDAWDSPEFVHSMCLDERGAAAAAVEHLVEHGREKIAMFTGPLDQHNSQLRKSGWTDALEKHGLEQFPGLFRSTGYSRTGGYEAAKSLIESGEEFDALFAANEPQAIGFLAAAHEAGITVPDDVAVIGFNGTSMGSFTIPALTVMEQAVAANAETAVECLLSDEQEPQRLWSRADLTRRASCGCTPGYIQSR